MNAQYVTTSLRNPMYVGVDAVKFFASNVSTVSKEIVINVLIGAPNLLIYYNAQKFS